MAVGLDDVKRIHLIGVGGCSMSGIAQILKKQGHEVTGSDRERSQFTDRLEELGIPVSIPQKGEQAAGAESPSTQKYMEPRSRLDGYVP